MEALCEPMLPVFEGFAWDIVKFVPPVGRQYGTLTLQTGICHVGIGGTGLVSIDFGPSVICHFTYKGRLVRLCEDTLEEAVRRLEGFFIEEAIG